MGDLTREACATAWAREWDHEWRRSGNRASRVRRMACRHGSNVGRGAPRRRDSSVEPDMNLLRPVLGSLGHEADVLKFADAGFGHAIPSEAQIALAPRLPPPRAT